MSIYLGISTGVFLLLQPILGVYVDRFNKVKIISYLDYIAGITDILTFFVLLSIKDTNLIVICIIINSVFNAIILAMYQPASNALIPEILKAENLKKGYSIIAIVENFRQILGVILASIIYGIIGYKLILLINGITFIVTGFIEMFIKVDNPPKCLDKTKSQIIKSLKEGFQYIKDKKEFINIMKISVIANIFIVGVITILLPYMINVDLNISHHIYTLVIVAVSLGGLLSAFLISKFEIKVKIYMSIFTAFIGFTLVFIVNLIVYILLKGMYINILSFSIILFCLYMFFGMLSAYLSVPLNLAYANNIDKDYYGRVLALRGSISTISVPFASIFYGYMLDNISLEVIFLLSMFGMLLSAVYTISNRYIRILK